MENRYWDRRSSRSYSGPSAACGNPLPPLVNHVVELHVRIPGKPNAHSTLKRTPIPRLSERAIHRYPNGADVAMRGFEPPSTHRLSGQKARRYRVAEIRNALRAGAQQNCEPATWLDYADPDVAPIRRSSSGPIAPIMHWLDYGDHPVARLRRSRNGSNMPVSDSLDRCRSVA